MASLEPILERRVIIAIADGVHGRPATKIAEITASLEATSVTLHADGGTASARSVIEILGLGLCPHSEVVIRARGPQAARAIEEISQILAPAL